MSTFPPPTYPPAGWYPDPSGGSASRFFDGYAWAPEFEERETHSTLPLKASLGALGVLVLSLIVGRILGSIVAEVGPDVIALVVAVVCGYAPSVVWARYVMRRWGDGTPASVGWRFRWVDLGWGPLTWLSAVASQLLVYALVVRLFHIPLTSNVEDVKGPDVTVVYQIVTVIEAVVAAPFVEELVFRGVIMRGFLSRMAPVVAVALQGLLFGFAHSDPSRGAGNLGLALVLSAVGIALGTSAYLTRRIGPTVCAHAIFNGVVMAILLSGILDDADKELGSHLVRLLGLLPG